MNSRLRLLGLTKIYQGTVAVDRLDLDIAEGEFVSLLGPSGCGKTTTLRMIAGFIKPDGGRIDMNGRMLSSQQSVVQPEHRNMSMIFQSYAIWPNMTVFQNVAFGLELRGLSTDEVRRRVGEILEVVRMPHLAERYPAELSGGQQQRIALARAIVVKPQVLLMDEPLSNLDANLREEMRYEIRRLHDEFKVTTIYVTHDQAEAMVTSDRIAVMSNGRIEQIDKPFNIYNRPRTRFVAGFIGRSNFFHAKHGNGMLVCDCFEISQSCVTGHSGSDDALISVRPQNIGISSSRIDADGAITIAAEIVQRGYLGEYWDYTAQPASGGRPIRITAQPHAQFEIGQRVWLSIRPEHLTVVADVPEPKAAVELT